MMKKLVDDGCLVEQPFIAVSPVVKHVKKVYLDTRMGCSRYWYRSVEDSTAEAGCRIELALGNLRSYADWDI